MVSRVSGATPIAEADSCCCCADHNGNGVSEDVLNRLIQLAMQMYHSDLQQQGASPSATTTSVGSSSGIRSSRSPQALHQSTGSSTSDTGYGAYEGGYTVAARTGPSALMADTGSTPAPMSMSMPMGATDGNQIAALNHGESSHHNGSEFGALLDKNEQTAIAGQIFGGDGSGFVDKMRSWTERSQFFNQGQTAQEKEAGTYLATNMASKFAVLNPNNFADEATASRVYGQAKSLAVKGDAASLGKLIDQYGDRHGLTNDELVQLYNVNEHEYLHHISGGSPEGSIGRDLFNSIHAFSLSSSDMDGSDGISAVQGGYNDKGQYPQWGWFDAAKRVSNELGL